MTRATFAGGGGDYTNCEGWRGGQGARLKPCNSLSIANMERP